MNLFSFPVRLFLAFRLVGVAIWLVATSASAQITLESGIGHQGEMQYRAGYLVQISQHWQLDTGLSAVRYKDEHYDHDYASAGASGHVFAADAVVLRQIELGGEFYLVLGTGPSFWSQTRWGAQEHRHSFLFSNEIGLGWVATQHLTIEPVYRHYSSLWGRPNTSIDFLGLQGTFHF